MWCAHWPSGLYRIRVAVRRPELAGHLQPLGRVGQIHAVQANVRYPVSVAAAVRDADVVINLVGVLFERGAQTLRGRACRPEPRRSPRRPPTHRARMVHISAIGADANSYVGLCPQQGCRRTGGPGRRAGRDDFSPSVQFGPEDDFFNRFAALARISPALPLIGGGATRFQPVFVGDVATAIADAVDGKTSRARSTNWAGPRSLPSRN